MIPSEVFRGTTVTVITIGRLPVAVLQHDITFEDAKATRARLRPEIVAAARSGAELIVLTEMFATGFTANTELIAEPEGGETSTFLAELAHEHGITLVGSICERSTGGGLPSNVAVVAQSDGSVQRYAKRHLFSYSGEDQRISAGNGFLNVEIWGVRISFFICYDLRFADDFWALAPDTDAYVVIANWPAVRIAHWRSLLIARAIENQAWVVGANRVGLGGNVEYSGDSLIVDPLGEVVSDGAGAQETILHAVLDAGTVSEVRSKYPFLADRR